MLADRSIQANVGSARLALTRCSQSVIQCSQSVIQCSQSVTQCSQSVQSQLSSIQFSSFRACPPTRVCVHVCARMGCMHPSLHTHACVNTCRWVMTHGSTMICIEGCRTWLRMCRTRSTVSLLPNEPCLLTSATWHPSVTSATWHPSVTSATWHPSVISATWHPSVTSPTWHPSANNHTTAKGPCPNLSFGEFRRCVGDGILRPMAVATSTAGGSGAHRR